MLVREEVPLRLSQPRRRPDAEVEKEEEGVDVEPPTADEQIVALACCIELRRSKRLAARQKGTEGCGVEGGGSGGGGAARQPFRSSAHRAVAAELRPGGWRECLIEKAAAPRPRLVRVEPMGSSLRRSPRFAVLAPAAVYEEVSSPAVRAALTEFAVVRQAAFMGGDLEPALPRQRVRQQLKRLEGVFQILPQAAQAADAAPLKRSRYFPPVFAPAFPAAVPAATVSPRPRAEAAEEAVVVSVDERSTPNRAHETNTTAPRATPLGGGGRRGQASSIVQPMRPRPDDAEEGFQVGGSAPSQPRCRKPAATMRVFAHKFVDEPLQEGCGGSVPSQPRRRKSDAAMGAFFQKLVDEPLQDGCGGSAPSQRRRRKSDAAMGTLVQRSGDGRIQKRKKPDAALEVFARKPLDERLRQFWGFVVEAVRGESSSEELCRRYELGGILPFIADVSTVIREILIPHHHDLGEQLWRVLVVVWLGGGGPGFATFRHVTRGSPLQGEHCPSAARLPALGDERQDVVAMYEHLAGLAERHGRGAVLSGDGQSVKFRFDGKQGVEVLRSWRRCARELVGLAGGTREGLQALGTMRIYEHFKAFPWLGCLTIKEIFCYLYPAHPCSIDVNVYVPVGSGAQRGGQAVLGLRDVGGVDWHKEFLNMARSVPDGLAQQLTEAIRARSSSCPFADDDRVPGVRQQVASGRPTAGDVEVCMCFFMNYLRAKHQGSVPKGWTMLQRSLWSETSADC